MKKHVRVLRILIAFSLVIVLAGMTTACGPAKPAETADAESNAAESVIDQIIKRGVMKVGLDIFVPWAMKDKTGELIGFEVDVAKRAAEDMGVDIEFVPTKWSGIIPALVTGKFDIIIGGMGVRPQRNLKVNFTIPYYESGMSLAANKELCPGWSNLEDFDKPDVVLTARTGATPVEAAKKFMPNAEIRMFDDEAQCFQEVINGRAHACVASAPAPEFMALDNPDTLFLPLQGQTFTHEPIGFAVRKGDFDTLNYFNNWITIVKAEGWLQEKYQYWFVSNEWRSLME